MDSFFDRPEKGCDRTVCPFNDGYMCTNEFGCICHESDFLNSTIDTNGENSNDTFKEFIR